MRYILRLWMNACAELVGHHAFVTHLMSFTPCQLLLLDATVDMKTLVRDARGTVPNTSGTNQVDRYRLAIVPRLETSTSYSRERKKRGEGIEGVCSRPGLTMTAVKYFTPRLRRRGTSGEHVPAAACRTISQGCFWTTISRQIRTGH